MKVTISNAQIFIPFPHGNHNCHHTTTILHEYRLKSYRLLRCTFDIRKKNIIPCANQQPHF
jgi:hypothetical protein